MNRRHRLDRELVRRKLAGSRTEAVRLIEEGLVVVDGNPTPKAASQVDEHESIRLQRSLHPYVGRGGLKMEAALDAFGLDPRGWRIIDVGASTGGFTDCLLQRGAEMVTAVDVGYGQLDGRLQNDPRVVIRDRTNIRHTPAAELGGPFDAVVADVSFISLCTIADRLADLGTPQACWILLVKPQFEVGRGGVDRGGIVRDPMLRLSAVESVVACLSQVGLGARGLIESPVPGAKAGNIEYLLLLRRGSPTLGGAEMAEVVR